MNDSDKEAQWQQWVDCHAPKLLLFARQKARSEADAQDLVQDAVMEACKGRPDGDLPPLPLLFSLIRRRAIDMARREDRRSGRERAVAMESQEWFDTSVEDRELQRLVQNAMEQLPDAYREIVTLKLWAGLTFAEAAEALGIPANTAASRYRYALLELKKLTKGVLA